MPTETGEVPPMPYTTNEEAVDYYLNLSLEMMKESAKRYRLVRNLPLARQDLRSTGIKEISDHELRIHFSNTGSLLTEGALQFQRVAEEFQTGKRRVQH